MTGVGLALPQIGPWLDAEVLRGFVEAADQFGYSSLWVQDHFMRPLRSKVGYVGVPDLEIPEQYGSVWSASEVMAAAAAWSNRCLIGSSVLVAGYHSPAQLAGRLATIDRLSRGRLVVGLGAGWCAEEHAACGVDLGSRGRRLDDFVLALLACWAPDPVEHQGAFFHIEPAQVGPKPVQNPRPPLICGGASPATLRRVARCFDGWNPAGMPVDEAQAARKELDGLRPSEMSPVEIWHHIFTQHRPTGVPSGTFQHWPGRSARRAAKDSAR